MNQSPALESSPNANSLVLEAPNHNLQARLSLVTLSYWLADLAVYGPARRPQDLEAAYHLSEVIKHWYVVRLALRNPSALKHLSPAQGRWRAGLTSRVVRA